MARIEFTVEALERDARGLIVCGRCCEAEIVVGDTFTELQRVWYTRSTGSGHLECLGSELLADVALEVTEIGFYSRSVESVPHGCTAGIRLGGAGLDALAPFEHTPDVLWLLKGVRNTQA